MELRSGDFAGQSKCPSVPSCSSNKSHTDVTPQLLSRNVGVPVVHSAVTWNSKGFRICPIHWQSGFITCSKRVLYLKSGTTGELIQPVYYNYAAKILSINLNQLFIIILSFINLCRHQGLRYWNRKYDIVLKCLSECWSACQIYTIPYIIQVI